MCIRCLHRFSKVLLTSCSHILVGFEGFSRRRSSKTVQVNSFQQWVPCCSQPQRDRSDSTPEWNDPSPSILSEARGGLEYTQSVARSVLHKQTRLRSRSSSRNPSRRWSNGQPDRALRGVNLDFRKCPCIQCQPRTQGRNEHPAADRVQRLHPNGRRLRHDVPTKRLPTKVWMLDDVGAHLECVTDEVGPIVA